MNGVAWSPEASLLATSSAATIRVFKSLTAELCAVLEGHTKLVTSVAFSPSGELLASSSWDTTVRVWCIHQQCCIAMVTGPSAYVCAVEFSPNGSYLACAARDSVWILVPLRDAWLGGGRLRGARPGRVWVFGTS